MNTSTVLLDLVLVVCLFQWCICTPYNNRNDVHKRLANRETKKDIFISRGWGAGGMPFSVLYMNPTFASKVAEKDYHRPIVTSKSVPQVRTSMRQQTNRRAHSVIPQLFVSYGWGPLGK